MYIAWDVKLNRTITKTLISCRLKPNSITLSGSKLVRSWSQTGSKLVSGQLRTSFEPASVAEFGCNRCARVVDGGEVSAAKAGTVHVDDSHTEHARDRRVDRRPAARSQNISTHAHTATPLYVG